MKTEDVKAFLEAVGTADWNMTYADFCKRIGTDGSFDYAKNKWHQWKALFAALNQFDAGTLAKLIARPAEARLDEYALEARAPRSESPLTRGPLNEAAISQCDSD